MYTYIPLPPNDSSFRALCLLFAHEPTYANLPIGRVLEFVVAIRLRQNFCAFEGDRLAGAVLWREIPLEVARESIRTRTIPEPRQAAVSGEALVATAYIAPAPGAVREMWDAFVASQSGRVILFERHYENKPSRLSWFDRKGRILGDDI